MRRRFVELDRGPVDVVELPGDDGAPLVFLHEGLGSIELWRGFPGRVHEATGRRTIVWSRHGYGRSAPVELPRPTSYMHDEARGALPQLLDALDVSEPVLVGHSDGASIALVAVGSGTVDAAALALLAPHVVVEDVSITGIDEARQAYASTDLPKRMARYHDDAEQTFRGWNDVWLSADFRSWDITEHLPGVDVPVLLVQGEDDQYGTLRQLDLVEQGVVGPTRRVVLSDCRHSPHLDAPEATLDAVVDFLEADPPG